MRFLYGLSVLMACLSTAFSAFFAPQIFNRAGLSERVVCLDANIDGNEPYLRCQNDAIFKIISATQEFSTLASCPLQFGGGDAPQVCDPGQSVVGQNVTLNIKAACDGQVDCTFSINNLPRIDCINLADASVAERDQDLVQVRISFECVMPRPHWRPFSNKRYNPKFSPSLFRPQRRISYNRMMQL